jgi:hypothetical protein
VWNEDSLEALREATDALMAELAEAARAKVAAQEQRIPDD